MNTFLTIGSHCPVFELQGFNKSLAGSFKLADIQKDLHLIFFPGAFTEEGLALKTYIQDSNMDNSDVILITTDSPEANKNFFGDIQFNGWLLSDIHHSTCIDYHCFNEETVHAFPTHIHMNEKHQLLSYYQGAMEIVIELVSKR